MIQLTLGLTTMTPLKEIDDFTAAYIEAALWASSATNDTTGEEYESLEKFDFEAIDQGTLDRMAADCAKFQAENAADLALAANLGDYRNREYKPAERAGHDFFLTRCGHGVGFEDRNLGDVGERLGKAAAKFGSWYFWVENETIFGEKG